jgi:hypothetical protein
VEREAAAGGSKSWSKLALAAVTMGCSARWALAAGVSVGAEGLVSTGESWTVFMLFENNFEIST